MKLATPLSLLAAALLAGCASQSDRIAAGATDATPPIVFVHGNGDTVALWQTMY